MKILFNIIGQNSDRKQAKKKNVKNNQFFLSELFTKMIVSR